MPTPNTFINLPSEDFINESFDFSVTFSNTDTAEGYGPYFNLYIPDGIRIGTPTYFGVALDDDAFIEIGTWDGSKWINGGNEVTEHPFGPDVPLPTDGVTGETLYAIELPFGSFVSTQPEAVIDFSGTLSKPDGAIVGNGLDIRTQGGFKFGADEFDNASSDPVIIESAVTSETITPIVWELTKESSAPEDETATGENFTRTFTLTVDIANGETVDSITIKDFLPDNLQFVQVTSVTVAGSSVNTSNVTAPSTTTPGGTLEYDLGADLGSVTGSTASNDIVIIYEAYVPELDAGGDAVLDPNSGDDEESINESQATGNYSGLDIFTGTTGFSTDDNNGTDDDDTDYTLQDKSIAIQKSVGVFNPGNNPTEKVVAGTVLEYTLEFQISDYFSFEDIVIDDIFSDGQIFDTSFTPELVIKGNNGNSFTLTGFDPANFEHNDHTTASGETTLQFRVSEELETRGSADGVLQGNEGQSVGTTGTITYRTVILEDFVKLHTTSGYTGDQSVDLSEVLTNTVDITGNIVGSGQAEADGSSASIPIDDPVSAKTIHAVNGVVVADPNNIQVSAGDLVTYRLTHVMPAADTENLVITDFLPLPVFDSSTLPSSVSNTGDFNVVGITYGPTHDLDSVVSETQALNPSVTTNAGQNTVSIDFGAFDEEGTSGQLSPGATIDLLVTVEVQDKPFADGLFLTNQAESAYGSTDSNFSAAETEIIQVELTQPELELTKAVVSTDAANPNFEGSTGPLSFNNPDDGTPFTGTVNSTTLAANPIDSDLTSTNLDEGIDAGDSVRFAIVVENTGGNDAFDVAIQDVLPTGFENARNVTVTNGLGENITFTGDLFTGGITLDDSSGEGVLNQGRDGSPSDDGRNIIIITYDATASDTVQPNESFTSGAELLEFAAQEGGTDFTNGLTNNNWTDDATVEIFNPSISKALTNTDQGHTDTNELAIGEIATYQLTVTLPEGQTNNLVVQDLLPNGLGYVANSAQIVNPASGVTTGALNVALAGGGDGTADGGNGKDITFNIDTVDVASTVGTANNTFVIEFQAIALDVGGNTNNKTRNNRATVDADGVDDPIDSNAAAAVIVVPNVTIDKSMNTTGDAGDVVTITLTVENTGDADAFESIVSDAIDLTKFTNITEGTTPSGFTYSLVGGNTVTYTAASGDPGAIAEGETVTFIFTATLTTDVEVGELITNTANVTQATTLPGTDPNERDVSGDDGSDTIVINSPQLTLNLVETEFDVSNNDHSQAVVGETVEYELVLTIPEGTLPDAVIANTLPEGMGFVSLDSVVVSNAGTLTSDQSLAVGDVLVTPSSTDGSSAQSVNFDLGTLVNSNTTDGTGTPETVTLRYTAAVLNTAGNQANTTLEPSAQLQWVADTDSDGNSDSPSVNATDADATSNEVTVVEPVVTVTKVSETNGTVEPNATGDAGDTAEFTITIKHDGSTPDAFEVALQDALPENFLYDAATAITLVSDTTGAGLTASDFEIVSSSSQEGQDTQGTLQFAGGLTVDMSGSEIVLKVTGQIASAVAPSEVLDSNTTITWSSLDGTVTDVASTNATNDDERDGSGSINDYTDSDNAPIQVENVQPVKSIAETSEAHTDDTSGTEEVAIGEIVRYRLVTRLSEGTLNGFEIQDTLPDGLKFLEDNTAKLAIINTDSANNIVLSDTGLNGAVETSQANTLVPTFDIPAGNLNVSGQDVTFSLGNITNTGTNTGQEFVIIEFNAIVENIAGNQADASGTTDERDNTFDVIIGGSTVATSTAVTVEIVEPGVEITQNITTAPVDGGDTVVYEITLENNGDSDAFEIQLTDILDDHLDLVSVNQTFGTGASINENTTDDEATVDISSLAPGESVTFQVTATVKDSAPVGYTIDNEPEVTYTSLPGDGTASNPTGSTADATGTVTGERTGDTLVGGAQNDYLDSDSDDTTLTAMPSLTAELVSTQLDNANNGNTEVVPGELVNYRITLEVPEGTTPAAVLSDTLDSGLEFVQFTNITTSPGVTYNLTDVASINANATINTSDFSIALGDIVNSNNDGAAETIVIEYQARVLNDAVNQSTANKSGPSLDNSVEFDWTGSPAALTDNADAVTVIEPKLTVDTEVVVGGDGNEFGNPGETVEYTITIQHAGDSETDAFDLDLSDVFPTEVEGLVLTSAVQGAGSTNISSSFDVTGQNLTTTGDVDLPQDETITLVLTGTLADPVAPGQLTDNDATTLLWQSMDGAVDEERTGDGTGSNNYIATDEDKPVVNPEITVDDVTVAEDIAAGKMVFTVELSNPSSSTVEVDYVTNDGTAGAGDDYTALTTTTLTFAPGETSKTIRVPIVNDNIDEADETYTVDLSNPVNATIADAQGLGTITDNDNPPAISIDDVTVAEDIAAGKMVFTVELSNSSSSTVEVDYVTNDGTAGAGDDYTALTTTTLTFAPGETSKTIEVPIVNDNIDEANETYTIDLSNPVNATIADAQGLGTITDNDNPPAISIDDVTVAEDIAAGEMVFTVELSNSSSQTVTVDYLSNDGTAGAGDDYTAQTTTTLTFAPGETSKTIRVPIVNDNIDEANETYTVDLSNPVNATIADAQGLGTITDNDNPPAISIDDVTVAEDIAAGEMVFTVELSNSSSQTVTVDYLSNDGTAGAGDDYTALTTTTLSFAPGETSKTIRVPIVNDNIDEADETYTIDLSNPVNATIGDAQGLGTIEDNDNPPAISIDDVTVNEADGTMTFTVRLSNPNVSPVTVDYLTGDDSALDGSDYTAQGGTLTFAPGEDTQTVTINISDDNVSEPTETYNLNLSNPSSNAVIADAQGVGTITDDETTPGVSVNDVTVNEADGTMTFRISLEQPVSSDVVVDYETADNTAVDGLDYTSVVNQATIPAGETFIDVTVPITQDAIDEADETLFINLTNVTPNATITDAQGVGTILDEDGQPSIQVDDVTVNEADGTMTFTVSLSNTSADPIAVDFATSDGTAVDGADYTGQTGTLNFAPGETTQTVTVPITADLIGEPAETLNLELSNPVNATIADTQGVGTIADTTLPAVSIDDVQVNEVDGTAIFTLTLDSPAVGDVVIDYETANNTASSATDYTAIVGGQVTIPDGSTTVQVMVPITQDLIDEPDEEFFVNLTGITPNATIVDEQGVGTIVDDDGVPTLRVDDVTVNEADGTMTFTIELSNDSGQVVTVDYSTADDSALNPGDYIAQTGGTLTFNPGEPLTQTVTIDITDDAVYELTENFTLNLSNPVNAVIADEQGLGTILDDESIPGVSVNDVTVNEADGTATFIISLSSPADSDVVVDYETADNGAVTANDYDSVLSQATIAPGETSVEVTVPITQDLIDELDEEFFVNLTGVSPNATIVDEQGVGTIVDEDQIPEITIDDPVVNEADGTITFTVELSNPSSQPVSVDYGTNNGTGVNSEDFTAQTGTLSFNPGQTTLTIVIPITDDAVSESPETLMVDLNNPVNAVIADEQGLGTILDDESIPGVSVNDVTVNEADGTATFIISLSSPADSDVVVDYETADNGAVTANDYDSVLSQATIAPGETSVEVTVPITQDLIDELDEEFFVNLTGVSPNATIVDEQGVGTIVDEDQIPEITIDDPVVNEADGTITFTVELSNPSSQPVSVDYGTNNGTGVNSEDFTAQTGTLSFNPGQTTLTIVIPITDDAVSESPETLMVDLNNPVNAVIADEQGLGTILDDESIPGVSVNDVTINEADGTATFTISLRSPADSDVVVDYETADNGAVTANDYDSVLSQATIAPGETSVEVTVPITQDLIDELDEEFFVNLTGVSPNATIEDNQGVGTIVDEDQIPEITIDDPVVNEADGTITFTVELSNPSSQPVSVDYGTNNGTGVNSEDFTAQTGTLSFNPGQTTLTIVIPITDDAVSESPETLMVDLNNPVNAVIADEQGLGTILDDESIPGVSVNDVTINEADGTATFTISLRSPADSDVVVDYETADNGAVTANDYDSVLSQATIAPGETSVEVTVPITQDLIDELDEEFFVNLTGVSPNATIEDNQGVGTIVDEDQIPEITIDDPVVNEADGTITFTVELSNPSSQPVSVDYGTNNGTGVNSEDFTAQTGTLSFNPGQTTLTIVIPITDDAVSESPETLMVDLNNPVNAVIADEQGLGTILDDESIPGVSVNDVTINEADGTATFTISLSSPADSDVVVDYETIGETATDSDFENILSQVTISAGATSVEITIPVTPDTINELDEQFFINLTGVTPNAVISDEQGVATIQDDDLAPVTPVQTLIQIPVSSPVSTNSNSVVAVDDQARSEVNTAVLIDVLGNDRDPDGDLFELDQFDMVSANGGTIEPIDGQLSYTPAPGFIGTDSFTYTIVDTEGHTGTATVTITVGEEGEAETDTKCCGHCPIPPAIDPIVLPVEPVPADIVMPESPVFMPATPNTPENFLEGTISNDSLNGTNVNDDIKAFGGNDYLNGFGGDDNLYGFEGSDEILGATGNDYISAREDNDVINASQGSDIVFAGKNNDFALGELGNDTLLGDEGNDTILGGTTNETVQDINGQDLLFGGVGNDYLEGNQGIDTLRSYALTNQSKCE